MDAEQLAQEFLEANAEGVHSLCLDAARELQPGLVARIPGVDFSGEWEPDQSVEALAAWMRERLADVLVNHLDEIYCRKGGGVFGFHICPDDGEPQHCFYIMLTYYGRPMDFSSYGHLHIQFLSPFGEEKTFHLPNRG
jgi:hypothetical protein